MTASTAVLIVAMTRNGFVFALVTSLMFAAACRDDSGIGPLPVVDGGSHAPDEDGGADARPDGARLDVAAERGADAPAAQADVPPPMDVGGTRDGVVTDRLSPDAVSTGTAPTIADGLLAHWPLDEQHGSPVANDRSGHAHHALVEAADPSRCWTAGRYSGALNLVDSAYLRVNGTPALNNIKNAVSLAVWVHRPAAQIADDAFIARGASYLLGVVGGKLTLSLTLEDGQMALLQSPHPLPTAWMHIAATWDGTMARLYVDGVEAASVRATGAIAGAGALPLTVGARATKSGGITDFVIARLDEAMVFQRALTAHEVATLAGR